MHDRDITVSGLYCDYLAQEEQSTMNMLGAILNQLLERDGIPGYLRQTFRKEKRGFGGRAVQLVDLVKILKTVIASLSEVFICIDALDECLPDHRSELLESLRDIVRASPTTRVFLSGRPYIDDEVRRYFTEAITIPIIPTSGDIENYLEMRLVRDTTPSAMDANLRAEIMRVIPRKFSQMCVQTITLTNPDLVRYLLTAEYRFLLVSLNIDAVLEEVTIYRRKKKLAEMIEGDGLRDTYSATLARIKAQKGSKSSLGMEVLMWLSHSERPLNVHELCHALGVEVGSTDQNSENVPAIETLLGCSLGLVTAEPASYTVRLVHHTLQEYLSNNTDLFHSPHSMIAQVCLTYLNFQCIKDLSYALPWPTPATPFLEYASCYWGTHVRRESTESVNTLALRLLDGFEKHVSSRVLLSLKRDNWDWLHDQSNSAGFTGLHGTAYLGMVETAAALLALKKWDLNATDMAGNTPISWAARKGHWDIVKMLLEQKDVTPETTDKDGRTPLSWAAGNGHEDIVKMFLERADVAPDSADRDGRTPLSWAAGNRNGRIVKIFLGREDVTPDTADKDGRTPLSWASGNSDGDIIKFFLDRQDVTPDTADKDGRTPLSWAAGMGNEGVVKTLLKREDVTPRSADEDGRTPLSWAAGVGCEGIVELLLEREDVAPDTSDKDGRTPLSWAAGNGYEDIVKALLHRGNVTPDTADEDGRTPLSWAAGMGYEGVVKMLLKRVDVTPDAADKDGRTPLLWAAGMGCEGIVRVLLEREDVYPDTTDRSGRTPLSWAAGMGREGIVEMFLEREDVAPDTDDKGGRTPLWWADICGRIKVVKMLRERCNLSHDIVTTDPTGQTALVRTSEKRLAGAVKRRYRDQDSVPHSVGSNCSRCHAPGEPSESSQRPSKRIR